MLGPRELEARDSNLRNGALNGGTSALRQQLWLRPVPGLGRPTPPVDGLYLASMSAHEKPASAVIAFRMSCMQ